MVVIDEILKGTNTSERVAASKAILEYIGKLKCITLVATYDNELAESCLYRNYYFPEFAGISTKLKIESARGRVIYRGSN